MLSILNLHFQIEDKEEAILEAESELKTLKKEAKSNSSAYTTLWLCVDLHKIFRNWLNDYKNSSKSLNYQQQIRWV